MIDYTPFYNDLYSTRLRPWLESLPKQVEEVFSESSHGDLDRWLSVLDQLPQCVPSSVSLDTDVVRAGVAKDLDRAAKEKIEKLLREFHPWRKGPFSVFDILIETEWRSDFKWNRLKNDIRPLKDKVVLDIGCGSGYHVWRMAGEEARLAVGIDPTLLYVMQFHAIQKFIGYRSAAVLPIGIDELPEDFNLFDTVFSMGILYHRRSPFDHLMQLRSLLRSKGELVLETLVIEGGAGEVLVPEGRYAKMPNVWFIPSCKTLESWLKKVGFKNIRLINVTQTTGEEQRVSDWMGFESLNDFLDSKDSNLTVEGYPAPRRAIFLADNV